MAKFPFRKVCTPLDFSPNPQLVSYGQGGFSGTNKEETGAYLSYGGSGFDHEDLDKSTEEASQKTFPSLEGFLDIIDIPVVADFSLDLISSLMTSENIFKVIFNDQELIADVHHKSFPVFMVEASQILDADRILKVISNWWQKIGHRSCPFNSSLAVIFSLDEPDHIMWQSVYVREEVRKS